MTEKRKQQLGRRTKARRRAVDILFEAEFRDVDPVELTAERSAMASDADMDVRPINEYTERIIDGVATHLDAIDFAIAKHLSSEWRIDRLPAVERAVLRVGAWEIMFNQADVPAGVAVKEAIQSAEAYSHVKASEYVNAVLDGLAKESQYRQATPTETPDAASDPERAEGEPGGATITQREPLVDPSPEVNTDTPEV